MKKWTYLSILALALLTLAVGGWAVRAAKSMTRPSGQLEPRPA